MKRRSLSKFHTGTLPLFEATRTDYIVRARQAAIKLGRERGWISIDDVRSICGPPPGVDPRVMGAIFREGDQWTCVGYHRSSRATCHNRPVALWRWIGDERGK